MTKGIEIPADQLKTILSGGREQTPLHTVVTMDDRRMNPFLSMEEFEKKWALQFEVIEDETSLEEYSDETKKKKGIPLNAQSGKNGWWYVGQTPVGKTVKGKFVPMIKIKAALKKKQMADKKKKAALLKKKKALALKKKKALALKKKKIALLKKKKVTLAKKKTTTSKKKVNTSTKTSSAIDALTPIKQYNHYKKVYDELKKKLKNYGFIKGTFKTLSKQTGIDAEELQGLYKYFVKHTSDYYNTPIYNSYGKIYGIQPYNFGTLPKSKKDEAADILKKIKAEDGGVIEGEFYSSTMNKYLIKNKIAKKQTFAQIDKEAQLHAKYIRRAKEQIQDAIDDWVSDSVWGNSPQRRKEIFKQISNIINHHNPRINKAKQVFRGVSFDPSNKNAFFKKYLSQFKIGKTIKLPPAGFSVDHTTASEFAVDEKIKVILRAKAGDSKGIRGLSVWQEHAAHKGEREIITAGGNYKVDKVVYHDLQDSGGKFVFIDLTQINNVNEEIDMSINDMETINGIMFGDSMRNTAKNMKKLSGMGKAKKKVTEKSVDTYSIDKTSLEK
jgi:hypothetical protein